MEEKCLTEKIHEDFRKHLIYEERSVATIGKYMRDIKLFAAYAGSVEITKETVISYKKHLSSKALFNNKKYKNLIIFDRGYPSRTLIHELEDKGFSYLFRCSHSFLSCVNACPDGDHIVSDIYKNRTTRIRVIQ